MKQQICIVLLSLSFSALVAQEQELTRYVNTLQGTNSKFELTRGNTYPTTAMPWGVHFWTPQTGPNGSGWIYQHFLDSIRGFRQTHQCSSWTNDYAAFSLMPVTGTLEVDPDKRAAKFDHKNEIARPHHYKVTFDNKITGEMAPTERGVHMRFKFPKSGEAHLVLDAYNKGGMVKIIPEERKIIGYVKNANFSVPENFANHFVMVFDQDFTSYGTWELPEKTHPQEVSIEGKAVGAYLGFKKGTTVQVKIASSYISHEQAQLNLERELGSHTTLEQTSKAAQTAWNKELNKVQVEGGSEEQKATFYSCFFRSMLFPRKFYEYDADGKEIYFSPYDGKVHEGVMFTDNGFWDTFRAQFPLNAILHPGFHEKYINSLLDAYDQSGWLPSWSFPGHQGSMVGNHAASLITDAWAKGFRSFDSKHAMEAIMHEISDKGPWGPANGRDGLKDYFLLGYVSYPKYREATAKTLEYCYNDWCAMKLAEMTGQDFYADVCRKQIFNYRNVFDPSTGFMRGRQSDGNWVPGFDPIEWGGPFTEGCAWHYQWSVFHDIQGLINLMGGDDRFTTMLDSVFTSTNEFKIGTYGHVIHEMTEMKMINMGQYAHGNQPIQHMIYLYNYAGQPWKSQQWARTIMDKLYNSGPNGYCGDEDQGQTSSWYVISAMGLYSVCPGTTEYVIGSPLFPKMTIRLENGKTFTIEAVNNSDKNVYIQSASLNGRPFDRNFLHYDELMNGGTIRYEMGDKPALERGVARENRPYSVSENLTGMDWPKGQAIPHFAAPADVLDGYSIASRKMPGTEKMMFAGLQGLINKKQPRIYLYDVVREGKNKWPDLLNLRIEEYDNKDKWELIRKYINELQGAILYNTEKSPHYMNVATTIAGLKEALPVTQDEYSELTKNGISLPVLMDISGLTYETPVDIYNYLYDNCWKDCTKRLIVSLPPRIPANIRDIAIASKAATLWLEPRNEEENAVLRKFLKDMKAGESIALGWWTEERAGIGICTEYGLSTIPSDFYENATVHAGLSHTIEMPVVPKKPELENKIYLAVFMSDGDNVQYCQHAMSNLWDDKGRGIIPINWTVSPGLVDIGPGILNYYYRTATPNDFFASGPSGQGYSLIYDAHNYKWNAKTGAALDPYTRFTQQYLEKSGLRVITIWDQINEDQMETYTKNCRYLYGVTQQDWERQEGKIPSFIKQNKLAFIPNYPCYANGIDVIYDMNKDTIQRFNGTQPIFLSAQGESWKMGPDNIVALKEKLEQLSPGNIVICRGDHFFTLYNEANGMDFNLTLSEKMKITASAALTPADAIADGTSARQNRWISSGTEMPQITFDFGREYKISRYVIRELTSAGTAKLRIETSVDEKSWTVADERPYESGATLDMDIQKVNARYVRLILTNTEGTVSIGDVEIYGAVTR